MKPIFIFCCLLILIILLNDYPVKRDMNEGKDFRK